MIQLGYYAGTWQGTILYKDTPGSLPVSDKHHRMYNSPWPLPCSMFTLFILHVNSCVDKYKHIISY